ncbi:DUF397 domain-containing protein [Streptomyces viridochromogenes]|uniref:DUF397 domain-containing protein n=1 Tax=Streptomyces viridochromogenes TaxID=1938 RepID=UPI00069E8C14|nr:DUF397 domain-containing protein [Streptomyces viridochromogenes]KOG08780.1 toxin-antitoxin system, toxin component [Streptomyces viridochromogenes]KOG09122.1 toxin-antitoxin system, toxin component [Streptomyces viridochromogenes]
MSSGTTELAWFKSSYSGSQGDDCVEIAIADQAVHVRDSKDLARPAFAVGSEGWAPFVRFVSGFSA